jgi:hypothetical protein
MMMIQVHDMIQQMKTSNKKKKSPKFIFDFIAIHLDMEHDVPVKSLWLPIILSVVSESRKDRI